MSPSTKKRPKNKVASKMQDEKLQDKINQPVSKVIERNRLKTVLKNLSLLKLFKSSNTRIQELHKLARRCWNSLLRLSKILQISSRNNDVCKKAKQNNAEVQEVRVLEKKADSKNPEFIKEPMQKTFKEWEPKQGSKGSPAAGTRRKGQEKSKVSKTLKNGLQARAQKRKAYVKKPRVVFLKTYRHRTPMEDVKSLDITDQLVWFEGLPTRIHIPGRRIMCRLSTLRCLKRSCTRCCSASL